MPDIQRIITIATQGANSGPYYNVYWSNNCSTYTLATDGSNVYLPSVGSSVFVTMPDTACCIKLVNLSPGCFLNEVVLNFCPTTTTSTTTLAPTTTTTLAPTTTTTLAPTTTTIAPTTTLAPTTTTTLTPTTTTTQPQFIQVEVCGGGDGPYIVTRGSGDIPAGIGQAFKLSGSYAGFNGVTCWEVLDSAASGPADYTNIAFGNVFNNCAACVPTTTTIAPTTTTTLTPTTTTTQPQFIQVELCGGGDGPYIITRGSGDSPAGIGQAFKLTGSYSGFNGIDCWEVLDSAASGPADYTNVGFGSVFSSCAACVPTTTTLAPTTPTLSPTTTTIAPTTTTPPTIYSVELCGGGQGPYKITYGTGDLPSGVGQAFKLNNGGTPFNGVDCWQILEYPVAGPADYTAVAFGSVFSNCAACVPTTTTTIAPTTTTIAPTTTTTIAPTTTTTFPPCVTSVTFEVDSAGDVRYVDCCGNTIYLTLGIGPQVINDCMEYGSLFGVGATISQISYNNTACTCPPTTTTLAPTTTTLAPTTTTTTLAPTTTVAPTTTTTTTEPPPAYNYYTFTPCTGGGGTDYRSILALGLGEVYTFLPYGPMEPDRACYEITDINAPSNTNDLPTIYGPVQDDCLSEYCQQL